MRVIAPSNKALQYIQYGSGRGGPGLDSMSIENLTEGEAIIMQYETIMFEVKEHVAYITLNRPEAANGINLAIAKDLLQAAIRCDEDSEIRAVLLTGAGKMFSAGGDLKYFASLGNDLPRELKETTVYCHAALSQFMRMNAPLITVVNGAAAGMGSRHEDCPGR